MIKTGPFKGYDTVVEKNHNNKSKGKFGT